MDLILRNVLLGSLPAAVRNPILSFRRRPLFDAFRAAGLVYLHVPRTGGTSISEAVYEHWVYHYDLQSHLETMPPDVLALPRFTVVRNPWDRALSCWSFASAGAGLGAGIQVRRSHRYRTDAFKSFDRFVLEWLPRQNLATGDPMFQVQCRYLDDGQGRLPYDHIGRFEDLAVTEQWLAGQLDEAIALPHLNRSIHGDYRDYYTAEMRDVIGTIYAEDVERLGYRF